MSRDHPKSDYALGVEVGSTMHDLDNHGALVAELFRERDDLRAKLADLQMLYDSLLASFNGQAEQRMEDKAKLAAIEARLVDRTAEWKLALGQRDTQRTSANRLREVLLWIGGDPNILIGPQATNILEIWKRARAALADWEASRP
jgi:hypothetical protein